LATESPVREGEFPASRFQTVVKEGSFAVPLLFAGVVLMAMVIHLVLARRIVTPWIMVDELIYSDLAKSFAGGDGFQLRDMASPLNNLAYPALIAPAWIAQSVETAYGLARAINVLVMLLAAVPIFLWGKRLMSQGYALLAAVLVLLMPSLLYTGMLMTENAFFTAFVSACFAIGVTLERPTLLRQALVFGAIGVVCAVRPQGLVLLPIYATALALKLAFDLRAPGGLRGTRYVLGELRRFLPSAVAIALLGAGYVVVKAIQGAGLETGLGAYGGVVKVEYDLSNAASWVVDHFAELTLSVAVIPVSALIVLFGLALLGRETSAAERAFLAVACSAFVLVVAQVGTFASRFSLRIEERNMFCVAPLLFLALSLWLARGLPRPRLLTAFAALGPAALLLTLNLRSLLNIGILSDTFGLIPLLRLSDLVDRRVDTVKLLMWGGGLAAGLAFALLPRRVANVVLPSGVALFLILSSYSVFGSIRDHSQATLALTQPSDPSWIDRRIGSDSEAAYLYGGTADLVGEAQVMWQTEFWNRSVGPVYRLGPPEPSPLPESAATFDSVTGRIASQSGGNALIRYVVAPTSVQLAGTRIAQAGRLALYRVEPPLRLAKLLGGVYGDSWMGADAALTQYATPSRRGLASVRVSRKGWRGPSPPGRVTIKVGTLAASAGQPGIGKVTSSRTWTVRNGTVQLFVLPTPKSPYRLEIHIQPTFSPADYGQADTRELGAQIEVKAR
jgi:hypothetical protein